MMISKSLTDLFIVLIALSFIFSSIFKFSWSWLNISWIRLAILFLFFSCISASISSLFFVSFSNGFAWIRFPLFAAAISFWLIKDREVLYFALFINFISIIFIFLLMGVETVFTDHIAFEWPFRNPLNGPFIHKIGILFFCVSFLIVFLELKYKTLALFFIFVSVIFSLLSGHRSGSFSFIIIIFLLSFWPSFKIKRSLFIVCFFFIVLLLYFSFNIEKLDRYLFDIFNFSNTSLLQYLGQWKTGLIVFFDNPIIGVGPTNVQNYLSENLIVNYDPFKNNEHPHNHYIQAFAETGLIGGILYIAMFLNITFTSFNNTKNEKNIIENLINKGTFITCICIFWPFANNYDLYGQQQNAYLWYVISIILVSHQLNKKSSVKYKINSYI